MSSKLRFSGKTLRAGVIGLGRQSVNDHVPALLRRKDVELVCVSDVNVNAHENFYKTFPELKDKVKAFQDFQDVIKEDVEKRLADSIEYALKLAEGNVQILVDDKKVLNFSEHNKSTNGDKVYPRYLGLILRNP